MRLDRPREHGDRAVELLPRQVRLAQLVGDGRDKAKRPRIVDPDGRAVLAEERDGLVLFLTGRMKRAAPVARCVAMTAPPPVASCKRRNAASRDSPLDRVCASNADADRQAKTTTSDFEWLGFMSAPRTNRKRMKGWQPTEIRRRDQGQGPHSAAIAKFDQVFGGRA